MKTPLHAKLPFSLGEVLTDKEVAGFFDEPSNGAYITLDAPDHGALALITWRLNGEERSIKQEETAKFIARACNNIDKAEELLKDLDTVSRMAAVDLLSKDQSHELLRLGAKYQAGSFQALQSRIAFTVHQYFADKDKEPRT
jgi:hypothetical protein